MKLRNTGNKAKRLLKNWLNGPDLITIKSKNRPRKGRVLFSYLHTSVGLSDRSVISMTHSNVWESREIARLFAQLGYDVDAISWTDASFAPRVQYDVIFDIGSNLQRLASLQRSRPLLLMHLTGSYARFQNDAETRRVDEMESRRGVLYSPRRIVPMVELVDRSIRIADHCSLIGNGTTLSTYPIEHQHKIRQITVTVANTQCRKEPYAPVREPREFLWYFGSGAVHKGLDLVLEVFRLHPEWTLHVVGNVTEEPDFLRAYRTELLNTDTIHYHGFLGPMDKRFADIVERAFCFLAPSCSEGISPAAAMCMQIGLYPVLTRNTGISLPDGCGVYIQELTASSLENAIESAYFKNERDLQNEISVCQQYAITEFSRDRFSNGFKDYLSKLIG